MEGSSLTNRLNVAMMKLGYDPSVGELAVQAVTLRPWARQLRMAVSCLLDWPPACTCTAAADCRRRRWWRAVLGCEQVGVQSTPNDSHLVCERLAMHLGRKRRPTFKIQRMRAQPIDFFGQGVKYLVLSAWC